MNEFLDQQFLHFMTDKMNRSVITVFMDGSTQYFVLKGGADFPQKSANAPINSLSFKGIYLNFADVTLLTGTGRSESQKLEYLDKLMEKSLNMRFDEGIQWAFFSK